MEKIPIGQLFRTKREAIGWSQERASEGICSVPTLSRIENGERMPSERHVRALMERLGIEDNRSMVLQGPYEEKLEDLQTEARAQTIRFSQAAASDKPALREEALAAFRMLESFVDQNDFLAQQRIAGDKIALGKEDGPYSMKESVEILLQAIRLTVPGFDLKGIKAFRYTMEEAKLINQIAAAYARSGEWEPALSIYRQLFTCLRENASSSPRYASHLAMVATNYARELAVCERYDEAITVAEEGRQVCVSYGRYQHLPVLLALLANCHAHLNHREESKKLYERAFAFYDEFGDKKNLARLKQDAIDTLGLMLFDQSSHGISTGSGRSS